MSDPTPPSELPPNPFDFRPGAGNDRPSFEPSPPRRLSPAAILFSFSGRIGRGTWWMYGIAANVVGAMTLHTLERAFIEAFAYDVDLWQVRRVLSAAAVPVYIGMAWINLALSAKRWHDIGRSGWWVCVHFVCCIGSVWALIENGLAVGDPRANRFGPPQA